MPIRDTDTVLGIAQGLVDTTLRSKDGGRKVVSDRRTVGSRATDGDIDSMWVRKTPVRFAEILARR